MTEHANNEKIVGPVGKTGLPIDNTTTLGTLLLRGISPILYFGLTFTFSGILYNNTRDPVYESIGRITFERHLDSPTASALFDGILATIRQDAEVDLAAESALRLAIRSGGKFRIPPPEPTALGKMGRQWKEFVHGLVCRFVSKGCDTGDGETADMIDTPNLNSFFDRSGFIDDVHFIVVYRGPDTPEAIQRGAAQLTEFIARHFSDEVRAILDRRISAEERYIVRLDAWDAQPTATLNAEPSQDRVAAATRLTLLRTLRDGHIGVTVDPAFTTVAPRNVTADIGWSVVAVFAVIGLLLGSVIALARSMYREPFHAPEIFQRMTGYPVLASVPEVRRIDISDKLDNARANYFFNNIRDLRARLQNDGGEKGHKVILITSTVPGEGKTTIAAFLARAFLTAGQSTILVDCDLKRRRLSSISGRPKMGLSHLLSDGKGDINQIIVPFEVMKNVDLLPAGQHEYTASDRLSTASFTNIVDHLRGCYDVVIIDSPPMISGSDVETITPVADVVLYLISAERTGQSMFKKHIVDLESVAGSKLRFIITRQRGRHYGHGYGYGYGYGYAYHGNSEVQ